MTDLFGAEPEPPRKGAEGYLAHLADLPYPDGLTFWALADGPRLDADLEWVWFITTDRQWLKHMINNRSGAVLAQLATEPSTP